MDLLFNTQLANSYHGRTQIARVLTEDWVSRNLYCPICGNPILCQYEANRSVADFYCQSCQNDFELKSKEKRDGELGKVINDGQYDKMIERINFVKAKIRQQLQYLRDHGCIDFTSRGHYCKII
ncbi:MAG: restriction endonuclease [Bacteroidaceae bacterium]|nr:restriction endonuclease [Bacteroidaceae bacterium]